MLVTEVYSFVGTTSYRIPLYSAISAGFPSPADDYVEMDLDLNEHLVSHPAATYFVRAVGKSMQDAGIASGDLLVVDKSLEAKDGDIVIASIDGQFLVKRFWAQFRQRPRRSSRSAKTAPAPIFRAMIPILAGVHAEGIYIIPKSLKSGEKAPLVISMHGGGGSPEVALFNGGANYHDMVSGGVKRGCIVFAPQHLFRPRAFRRTFAIARMNGCDWSARD